MKVYYIQVTGTDGVYHDRTFTTEALALKYVSEWCFSATGMPYEYKFGSFWEGNEVIARLRQATLYVE